jgi:hypothetical protein
MRTLLFVLILIVSIYSCKSNQSATDKTNIVSTATTNDTIRIANEELEYEIIIIEVGFDSWLVTQKPMWFYSNNTLAFKNHINVIEWNQRVINPTRFNSNLYEQMIDYDPTVDYGIEVNYKLFMYFKYFQERYKQRL